MTTVPGLFRSQVFLALALFLFSASCTAGPPPVAMVDTGEANQAWMEAMAAYLGGDWDRADTEFGAYADKHPASSRAAEVPYWRGLAHLGAGRPDDALPLLRTALREGAGIIPLEARSRAVERAKAAARRASAGGLGERSYFVQVGAFGQRGNADELIARLDGLGFRAVRVAMQRGAGRLYAVRVGPVAGLAAVGRLKARLRRDAGLSDAILVEE